jgi:response regulator RpfG family c-di-GMP phosphodiesterase
MFKKLIDKITNAKYNNSITKRNNTRRIKVASKNYSDEMVAKMTETYEAEPTMDTVKVLAREFGKTTRSIIAKLSREGVYKAQPRTTKTGEPVVQKKELVMEIATMLGVDEANITSLVKATKGDLKNLVNRLSELV